MKTLNGKFLLSLIAVVLLPALAGAASPAEVFRTGQATSYAAGDDGDIRAGVPWPSPRFINNTDGTITDKLTGLEWSQDANPPGGSKTWQQALAYVKTLDIGGHTDWRMPNVNELESLLDAEYTGPALLQGNPFINVQLDWYWVSTYTADNGYRTWVVSLVDGKTIDESKTAYHYVWPVRTGQCGPGSSAVCLPKTGQTTCTDSSSGVIDCGGTGQDGDTLTGVVWPDPRFIAASETVTDNLTGLMWSKAANVMLVRDPDNDTDGNQGDGLVSWQHALDYVAKLNHESFSGYVDWRLPNRKELRSLLDFSQPGPPLQLLHPFTNLSNFCWTSTAIGNTGAVWGVSFVNGAVFDSTPDGNYRCVWPVRGGSVITTSTTTTTAASTTTTVRRTSTSVFSSSTTTTAAAASTTTTTANGGCPIVKTLGAHNPKLENLRTFRDSSLAHSALGNRVIQLYYDNAESINAALERSPALQTAARRVLEIIAPLLAKK